MDKNLSGHSLGGTEPQKSQEHINSKYHKNVKEKNPQNLDMALESLNFTKRIPHQNFFKFFSFSFCNFFAKKYSENFKIMTHVSEKIII